MPFKANAARRLDELRRNWLNPPSHVTILPEVVPGFPDRIVPIDDKAAAVRFRPMKYRHKIQARSG
jgi:hypothetical protein